MGIGGAPTVTGVSPNDGPQAGGTPVTITGTNFSTATVVKFGTTLIGFSIFNNTTITVNSPAGTGIVNITVTNTAGTSATSSADLFYYIVEGAAILTATSALPVNGNETYAGTTVLQSTSTLIANAIVTGPVFGTATLISTLILGATGIKRASGTSTLFEASMLTAAGGQTIPDVAMLHTSSLLKAVGNISGDAPLRTTSTLTASVAKIAAASALLLSSSSINIYTSTTILDIQTWENIQPPPVWYPISPHVMPQGWTSKSTAYLHAAQNQNALTPITDPFLPNNNDNIVLFLEQTAPISTLFYASDFRNDSNNGNVSVQAAFLPYDLSNLVTGADIQCGLWCRGAASGGIPWGNGYVADLQRHTVTLSRWVGGVSTTLASVTIGGGLIGWTWYLLALTANETTISVSLNGAFGQIGPNVNFSYAYNSNGTLYLSPQTIITVLDSGISGNGTSGLYLAKAAAASSTQTAMSDNWALYAAGSASIVSNAVISAPCNSFRGPHSENWDNTVPPSLPFGWATSGPTFPSTQSPYLFTGATLNAISPPNVLALASNSTDTLLSAASDLSVDFNDGNVAVRGYFSANSIGTSNILFGLWCRGTPDPDLLYKLGYFWSTSYLVEVAYTNIQLSYNVGADTGPVIIRSISIPGGLPLIPWFLLSLLASDNLISVWLQNQSDGTYLNSSGVFVSTPQYCISVIDNNVTGPGNSGLFLGQSAGIAGATTDNWQLLNIESSSFDSGATLSATGTTQIGTFLVSASTISASGRTFITNASLYSESTFSGSAIVDHVSSAAVISEAVITATGIRPRQASASWGSTTTFSASGVLVLIASIYQNSPTSPLGVSFSLIVTFSNGSAPLTHVTGQVVFNNNGTPVGTASVDATGIVNWIFNNLAIGSHTLDANYLGNASYPPFQTPPVFHEVTSPATSIINPRQTKVHQVINFLSSIPTDPSTNVSYMTTWGGILVGGSIVSNAIYSQVETISGVKIGGSAIITQNFDIIAPEAFINAIGEVTHNAQLYVSGISSIQTVSSLTHDAQAPIEGNSLTSAISSLTHNAQAPIVGATSIKPISNMSYSAQGVIPSTSSVYAIVNITHNAQGIITGKSSVYASGMAQGHGVISASSSVNATSDVTYKAHGVITASSSVIAIGNVSYKVHGVIAASSSVNAIGNVIHNAQGVITVVSSVHAISNVTYSAQGVITVGSSVLGTAITMSSWFPHRRTQYEQTYRQYGQAYRQYSQAYRQL